MEKTQPPKHRDSSDSFPAVSPPQEERLWRALEGLEKGLAELNEGRARDLKRSLELEDKVDEHDVAIREMRESTLASRELASKFDRLNTTVTQAIETMAQSAQVSAIRTVKAARTEADQDLRIIEIEAALKQSGAAAGKKAGLTWGGGAAVIGTILGALAHYLMQAAASSGH